jgi:hypothetical protein
VRAAPQDDEADDQLGQGLHQDGPSKKLKPKKLKRRARGHAKGQQGGGDTVE